MAPSIHGLKPRRSAPGPHTSNAATPKRAYLAEDTTPILSGYTYEPNQTNQTTVPEPDLQASMPLVPTQLPSDSITNYRPTKQTGWLVMVVVFLVMAIATAIIIHYLPPSPQVTPSEATESPTVTSSSTRQGGIVFSNEAVTGYWKITNTTWQPASVTVVIEITVDSGLLHFQFFAYDSSGHNVDPIYTAATDLEPGFIASGETVIGTLTFPVERQPLTLVMFTDNEQQLSALPVIG